MKNQEPLTIDGIRNFSGAYPKQLYILFFTEMWERFTFYGMRALLMLYMTTQLHFDDAKANLTYGAYQAFVYAMPVFGGLLADRIFGQRKSIFWGGILMAIGNFVLAVPGDNYFFYAGMAFIICGNGFFKPNISTMVGSLYHQGDHRRDAGFSLFYMGINFGAMFGGLICGAIGQMVSWHLGFGVAGVFMLLGLLVFRINEHKLGPIGLPNSEEKLNQPSWFSLSAKQWIYIVSVLLVPMFMYLLIEYQLIDLILPPFGAIALAYVLYLGFKTGKTEGMRIVVALVLTVFSMLFWTFYEQGGGSLNLFADRNVNMDFFGIHLSSAAVNNSINGAMIILLSPVFGWLWLMLSKRKLEPNSVVKFSLGLMQLGLGFYMFVLGGQYADAGMVSLFWFVAGYFFMTTGELCLSPIGLSSITKLSPNHMVGLMMGMWFLASAVGQYLAGIIGTMMAIPKESGGGKIMATESLAIYTGVFNKITLVSIACGLVLLMISPILKKWMFGIKG